VLRGTKRGTDRALTPPGGFGRGRSPVRRPPCFPSHSEMDPGKSTLRAGREGGVRPQGFPPSTSPRGGRALAFAPKSLLAKVGGGGGSARGHPAAGRGPPVPPPRRAPGDVREGYREQNSVPKAGRRCSEA